jgi:hypothetical protein
MREGKKRITIAEAAKRLRLSERRSRRLAAGRRNLARVEA